MRLFLSIAFCGAGALLPLAHGAEADRSGFYGRFLGQPEPGYKPQAFAPELFSVWGNYGFHLQASVVFSATGKELFFTNQMLPSVRDRSCSIFFMERTHDHWTEPRPAAFSSEFSDSGISLSPDGRFAYFMSTRPVKGSGRPKDADIWFVHRTDRGWSDPEPLAPPINGPFNDIGGAVTASGTLFFSSDRPGGNGSFDIYSAVLAGSSYADPQNLGKTVNTGAAECLAWVAADSSFLIFHRYGSMERQGAGLYVTYRTAGNTWTEAKRLGDQIVALNASGMSISPDGRYLFLLSQGDGMYWLSADLIEYLKTNELGVADALLHSYFEDGIEAALHMYNDLKQKHARYVDIDEFLLNAMGYHFVDADKITEAIGLFSIVAAIFPDSWNAYDSLGEAYVMAGDIEAARMCYRRSLELNPKNQNAIDALKVLETR